MKRLRILVLCALGLIAAFVLSILDFSCTDSAVRRRSNFSDPVGCSATVVRFSQEGQL